MDFTHNVEMKWKNLEHLLIHCSGLGQFWSKIENVIGCIIPSFHFCDFYILVGYFVDDRLNDIVNVVIPICRWCIWRRRHNFKYENDTMSESEFFQWLKSELKQHFALIKKDKIHMKICKYIC